MGRDKESCAFCDVNDSQSGFPDHEEGCPVRIFDDHGAKFPEEDAIKRFNLGCTDAQDIDAEFRYKNDKTYMLGWRRGQTIREDRLVDCIKRYTKALNLLEQL